MYTSDIQVINICVTMLFFFGNQLLSLFNLFSWWVQMYIKGQQTWPRQATAYVDNRWAADAKSQS